MKSRNDTHAKNKLDEKQFLTFVGYLKCQGANDIQEVKVTIDKPIEDLTYDEVEFAIDAEIQKKESNASTSGIELYKIAVIDPECSEFQYPVFHEDDPEIEICKRMSSCKKCLVLPNATYALSPEYELWLKLEEEGIVDDVDNFDYEKMHRLLESIQKALSKVNSKSQEL